jgi:ornithine decarboxylase
MLAGPFLLPYDVRMGDYIEIGQMGASGKAMRRDSASFISPPSVIVKNTGLTIRI